MSLNLGVMSAAVTLDDADYRRKLAGLEGSSEATFKKIAQIAAGYLTIRAIGNFVSDATKTFSDLQEETNKFNVVFHGMGSETVRILDELQKKFGLSELAAKKMLAGTGDILTGFGFDRNTALALSEGTAKLGADLASFSNYVGGAEGASYALTKAMLGEMESAKMLGVVIRQDDENYKSLVEQAMTTGVTIDALGKTFTVQSEQQAKAVAALAMAYQQSPNAIGDFVRSQDSIANQTRILENNFQQFSSTLGGDLSDSYQRVLRFSNGLLKSYNDLSPATRHLVNNTAMLSAAILVLNNTKIGKSILSAGKGMTDEEKQAAQVKAQEEIKRAQTEMTTAFMEEELAKQNLVLAKNSVAVAKNAVVHADSELIKAKATGDVAKIAAAQDALNFAHKKVTEAKLQEAKATSELQSKTNAANTAVDKFKSLNASLPALLNSIAASSTLAGRASMFLSGGFKTAALSVKAFFAALGPVGWTILAISAAYIAITAVFDAFNKSLAENAELAKENIARLDEALKKQNEIIASNLNSIERLKELQKYENLNNKEREEAKRLLEETGIAYDEKGRSIDEMISRQGEEKRSLAELIEMRKQELKERRIAALEEQINARKQNIQTTLGYNDDWTGIMTNIATLFDGGGARRINENDQYIQGEWDKIKKLREELRKLKKDELSIGETEAERNSKNAEAAVRQRKALESLSDKEWDIKFNSSSADEQNSMLSEKIDGVFSEYKRTGKYKTVEEFTSADRSKMTEQELNDLQKIVDLEAQRANLRKQSATAFESERESYASYLKNLEKQKQEKAVNREIEAAKKAGDLSGVDAIMQREFAKARDAANAMKREYERALKDAEADGIFTEAEKKKISELRRGLEDANSAAEKYANDKISADETKTEETKRNSDAAGAFNSKILASIFGQAAPMEETANNTRRTAEYVREMLLKNENSSLRYS